MLTLLTRLKNRPRIEAFLTDVSAAGAFTRGDADAIVEAAGLLPPAKAANLIGRIVSGNAQRALSGCGRLLARGAGHLAHLTGAATILVEALPGDPAKEPEPKRWDTPRAIEPGFIVDLAGALDRIDPILAERAASHLLAWPKTYGLDAVLIPAVLALTVQPEERNSDTVRRLRGACLNHLRARIAEILEPPADWRRDGVVSCNCQHCRELNVFLSDPDRQSWTFKAAEAKRRHVEQMVRQDRCDLHLTTERRGSPHGLVCTKNQASYERRARQRKADLENLARLQAPLD